MKEYLLSIDIGTSSCKVVLFDVNGTVISTAGAEYPVYYPKPGYAEQNPEEWFAAVCKAIKGCLGKSQTDPSRIAGIGVDGQSWSAIALDKNGEVLCNTPIWMDTRAEAVCEKWNRQLGEDAIFDLCKNKLQPSYTTGKILWYKEMLPEVYKKTDKILQSNSYIVYRLTGKLSQDISQGYGLHCFDMEKGTWDKEMCREFGFPHSFLPEIHACHDVVGTVTEEAAVLTGLMEGIPVVAGGLDAASAALGVGVLSNGQTQEQGGTAGGMSICMDQCLSNKALILGYHVVPGKWLLQGGTVGGGGVMKWFEEQFGDYERLTCTKAGRNSFELLSDLAETVPAGSDKLIFLPYMSGERSPIWDVDAKGVFYGLDYAKTKAHFVRAIMESVAFSLKHNIEKAEESGAVITELRAMGGAANSLVWTQIKADVVQRNITVPSSDTATALGAAILAGVGVGVYSGFADAVSKTVSAKRVHTYNPENRPVYERNYQIYLELYQNLKNMMKKY